MVTGFIHAMFYSKYILNGLGHITFMFIIPVFISYISVFHFKDDFKFNAVCCNVCLVTLHIHEFHQITLGSIPYTALLANKLRWEKYFLHILF